MNASDRIVKFQIVLFAGITAAFVAINIFIQSRILDAIALVSFFVAVALITFTRDKEPKTERRLNILKPKPKTEPTETEIKKAFEEWSANQPKEEPKDTVDIEPMEIGEFK